MTYPSIKIPQFELRHKPRLIIHTGDGKGKSTAAFGMTLRAWAQGWSIGIFQFIKSKKWPTGEQKAFHHLAAAHKSSGLGGPIEWQTLGPGRSWLRSTRGVDQAGMARQGWQYVRSCLASQTHQFYVLDEFAHVLNKGWLDIADVCTTLKQRPGIQHVVITGRNCPAQIIDIADLVTSMEKIKHPFDAGERGQEGIEW